MQSVGLQAPWVSYDFRVNSHAVFTSSSFTHTQTVVNTATATRPFRSTLTAHGVQKACLERLGTRGLPMLLLSGPPSLVTSKRERAWLET